MRLAMLAPGYAPDVGGVETAVTELSRALARAGVDVEVWTQSRRAEECTDSGGVRVRRLPLTVGRPYPVSVPLWRHAAANRAAVDLVHGHSFHSVAALGLLKGAGVPYVFSPHYHGVGHTALARLLHVAYGPLGSRLMHRASAVIAVSAAEAAAVRRDFPDVREVQVLPHGVDACIAEALPVPSQPPTVLVAGRLEPYKHVDSVIAAFHALAGPAQLVVTGDGSDRDRLEALAADGARRADIRFLGAVDREELNRWLRTARVAVSMSEHEAFGLIGIEAATAGAHALLSDIPAHREVAALVPGRASLVADRGPALTHALASRLAACDSSGPVRVRSWDDVAEDHLACYEKVLRVPSRVSP